MTVQPDSLQIPGSLQMAIEVERGLREQQLGIFFVMPRVVRRVLQSELDIASPWQPPPHRKVCVIPRDRLLWLVARDELGVSPTGRLPDQLILVAQPEEDQLVTMTRQELYRHYWRLMFHGRIDYVMTARTKKDQMSVADLRRRIDQLGQTEFDEIRSVLRSEQMLLRPDDDRNVYAEFVAVYHELSAFAPQMVPLYFPSLPSRDHVLSVIGPECDAVELLNSTRPTDLAFAELVPSGSADPSELAVHRAAKVVVEQQPSPRQFTRLSQKAEKLSLKENNVRAALAFQSAVDFAPEESIAAAKTRLEDEIKKLVVRLQSALELSDEAARPWLKMCERLLPSAQHGFWNANARLLYDLQNVCFDHEHEIYKVDLLRWTLSGGKTPLKRPLSNQRVVLMSKHLRAATLRVPHVEIDPDGRQELSELLHEAADAAEHILRVRLEPLIETALLTAGFEPASVVERVSLKKMVQELGDGVVNRGFITLGSLRDAVSRNQLKMSDLKNSDEFFFTGDPLLRADRLLSASLDGVYQRGPFYLRWLQKLNSLAFGIPGGRFLTRYFALPFGLAYLLLRTIEVAAEHLLYTRPHPIADVDLELAAAAGVHPHHVDVIYSTRLMILLGFVIFALIHFPEFRRRVVWCMSKAWSLLKVILIEIPHAIVRWKVVDRFLKSFPMMLLRRFVLAPVSATIFFWVVCPWLGFYGELNRWWGIAIFLSSFLILNSRMGRDTEELAREFFARTWYRIRVHLFMGLITLVIDVFQALLDGLERLLYAVDEWLRYRSGESKFTLGIKAVFGLVWALVHGVIRFCVTLLIEPQVNPIKHFPVVTVSHKLVITTLTIPISSVLQGFFDKPTAYTITALVLTSIPGVFGFLAWELKENWKLYRANRSPNLKPVLVGDHGETLLRLLSPGFHSGTIPRLFAKQRRAARQETGLFTISKQATFVERLHHEAKAVRHFIERELLVLLSESRTFRGYVLTVDRVELTTNRVLVSIGDASTPNQPVRLEFAEQSGWLIGVTREFGWLDRLEPEDVEVFKAAVTGLYKLAAVDLVREQIEGQLVVPMRQRPAAVSHTAEQHQSYDIGQAGLVVWPNGAYDMEIHYPLDEVPVTHPRPRFAARSAGLEPLPTQALVFRLHTLTWDEWTQFWENERFVSAHSIVRFPFKW